MIRETELEFALNKWLKWLNQPENKFIFDHTPSQIIEGAKWALGLPKGGNNG